MENMENIVTKPKKKINKTHNNYNKNNIQKNNIILYNCRNKEISQLNNKCLTNNVIYKAIETNNINTDETIT